MKKLLFLIVALLTAMTAWASTFTVTNSGSTFTITRSSSSGTETVYYRTVSLTAIAGVHFTEAVGTLAFSQGESVKTVTVTETPSDGIAEQYKFQTGTTRNYRFEVLDLGGFQLAYKDRDITYGTDYQHTADYVNKSITDLVYFDNSGNIRSGDDNKYLDVAYSSSDWIKVTDAGYPQGVHTVSTDGLYHGSSVLRTYLDNQCNKMYATVYFTQKEEEDGYQYIQILADNSTTYDENDTWGAVYDPSTSIYKACFEMRVTDGFVTDEHYQFFPHRYDHVNKAAEIDAGLSCYSFDYDDSHLYEQKYQSSSYNAPNTGSLDLETTVNNLDIRFDAGGRDKDDWDFKDLKVRLALVDTTAPTVLDNYKVGGGLYCKGNTIYVSVPFSEIVTVSSTPTLSTTWGTLNYVGGSGSNVLTFSGTIGDNASGTFTVSGYSGTFSDLAGNPFGGSISHSFDIGVSRRYTITYDLAGGSLPEGKSNPETYTELTATFTLNNPTRPGYSFTGWTGSNGDTPQTVVTIEQGSEGDRSYIANWELLDRYYTFDSETGALALIWGEYNYYNKWGSEVTASAVKSVTATSEVSFTGDCSNLFYNFNNCESMDLNNVNTSEMTNCYSMFNRCSSLDSLDLSGWNTAQVTNMGLMFYYCSRLTSLDLSSWNTANVTNMGYMFYSCWGMTSLDLTGWNTKGVTNMDGMFCSCSGLTSLDLAGFNTESVTDMGSMFQNCSGLTSLDLSGFNTESVTDMCFMFKLCKALTTLDLSGFNTENVTDMREMFSGCSVLSSLNLSGFNTEGVTDMSYMFTSCKAMTTLDLSSFNTANVTNMRSMFSGSSILTIICVSEDWNTEKTYTSVGMFSECYSLVGGMGTTFDNNHTDKTYARIDGGPDNPGYFTVKTTALSDDEYIIYTATDWDTFCDMLAGGESFSGKTVKLGADISVSRMAGKTGSHVSTPFAGTFDGCGKTLTFNYTGSENYIAPFYWCSSSPIFRNLTVSGTINTTGYYAGGLIGHQYGMVTIEHCTSNVDITCTGNSGGFMGSCVHSVYFNDCLSRAVMHSDGSQISGFVGWTEGNRYTMNFTGCVFNGKLLKLSYYGGYAGGFIGGLGWNKIVTFTDCLVNPAALADGETMPTDCSETFARPWNSTTTATNSYYTTAIGTPQCKHARSITAGENVTVANAGTPETVYNVSGITAYPTGIKFNDVLYAADSDNVSLTLGHSDLEGYAFNGYEASAGTLSGSDNPYTLIMPDEDVTLTALYVSSAIRGDVDGNGTVGISDVTALIDYILTGNATGINLDAADCDLNGNVGIADATAIIDYILNGQWP